MEKISSLFINDDEDFIDITDKINSFQETLKSISEDDNIISKFDFINEFYNINLHDFQENVNDTIYSPIEETFKTFPEVENKIKLFNFNLEKCQALKPPENYKSLINDESQINKYEKFVCAVNFLVSNKNLINFEEIFRTGTKEIENKEELITERILG